MIEAVSEAVILAGGLGTRLRSVVPDLPKSMAQIAGRPFLSYVLEWLELNGVRRVILAVGYRREAIREYFGSRHGAVELCYSIEEEPLGTGGALRQALREVHSRYVLALNGDTFLRLDYRRFAECLAEAPGARLVVALREVADSSRYGTVLVDGPRIQRFAARGAGGPGLINAGAYLVSRNIFDGFDLAPKFSFEQDFLEIRVGEIAPIACQCDVPFLDIGTPEALADAQHLIPEWVGSVQDPAFAERGALGSNE